MGATASQITSLTIVYSNVYSSADQQKHQSSASLVIVRGIHRWPVNSPHKWSVTRKMFPFDDVIIARSCACTFHLSIVVSKIYDIIMFHSYLPQRHGSASLRCLSNCICEIPPGLASKIHYISANIKYFSRMWVVVFLWFTTDRFYPYHGSLLLTWLTLIPVWASCQIG